MPSAPRLTPPFTTLLLQQSQPSGAKGCAREPMADETPVAPRVLEAPEAPTEL